MNRIFRRFCTRIAIETVNSPNLIKGFKALPFKKTYDLTGLPSSSHIKYQVSEPSFKVKSWNKDRFHLTKDQIEFIKSNHVNVA